MFTRILIVVVALLGASLAAAADSEARKLGRAAFQALEEKPFEPEAVKKATADAEQAQRLDETDPWAWIAASRAALEAGYRRGDRRLRASYEPDAITKAHDAAKRAVERGPRESMAHVQLARIRIITDDNRGASESLDEAQRLDPAGFYPRYYRSVVALKMDDAARSLEAIGEAEKRAEQPYMKSWALYQRMDVARHAKDLKAEEQLHRRAIELDPKNPFSLASYAFFLRNQQRFDESIEYYEKAVAIRPIPVAVEQLKLTRMLRDAMRPKK